MLDLFQWFYLQKIEGRNPFWRLLELIAESNDYENVNNAQVDEVPDVEGAAVGGDDVETIKVWSNFHFSFSIILCLVQKKKHVLVWIDPNYFGSLCSNPNEIQTNDMVGGVMYFCQEMPHWAENESQGTMYQRLECLIVKRGLHRSSGKTCLTPEECVGYRCPDTL